MESSGVYRGGSDLATPYLHLYGGIGGQQRRRYEAKVLRLGRVEDEVLRREGAIARHHADGDDLEGAPVGDLAGADEGVVRRCRAEVGTRYGAVYRVGVEEVVGWGRVVIEYDCRDGLSPYRRRARQPRPKEKFRLCRCPLRLWGQRHIQVPEEVGRKEIRFPVKAVRADDEVDQDAELYRRLEHIGEEALGGDVAIEDAVVVLRDEGLLVGAEAVVGEGDDDGPVGHLVADAYRLVEVLRVDDVRVGEVVVVVRGEGVAV